MTDRIYEDGKTGSTRGAGGLFVVLGAMEAEITEYLKHLENARYRDWNGYRFHRGRLCGAEVLVSRCGVGKTLSAMVTQRLIDTMTVSGVICTGIAGAINPDLEIGDTIIARDCIQHDMDARPTGFARGEIPFTGIRIIETDPVLRAAAETVRPGSGRTVTGRILTGDQFLTRANSPEFRYLREELDGDAVEMEGASIGLVASVNRVPFLVIRTISDRADGKAAKDFQSFLGVAARRSWQYLSATLQEVS